tara:strand:+ start:501 stop:1760 length:1260 start_codon:yes stop_codon:yes gene_type:complete
MNFSSKVAVRYLSAARENLFFSWISFLSIIGIAIGIAVMIVVLSVIDGFEEQLQKRFLAANAHILAYKIPKGISHYSAWEEKVLEDFRHDISGISPFLHSDTMGRKGSIIHSILVKGIYPEKRKAVEDISSYIKPSNAIDKLQKEFDLHKESSFIPKEPSVILGIGLATLLDAKIGDVIELISPGEPSEQDSLGQMYPFRVVGFYDSGLQHYDNKLALLSLPAAQKHFKMEKAVTGLEIGLKRPKESIQVAAKMRANYSLSIKEWQSFNSNIFEAMKTERVMIGFIVALVAFVASFNILTTLFISVSQKQRDISLFKSLGASHKDVILIFLKQSFLMGFVGGVGGVLLALFISFILIKFPFIDLPDVYMITHLPVKLSVSVYLEVFLIGVGAASLAGLYPAFQASKVLPSLGLQVGRRM